VSPLSQGSLADFSARVYLFRHTDQPVAVCAARPKGSLPRQGLPGSEQRYTRRPEAEPASGDCIQRLLGTVCSRSESALASLSSSARRAACMIGCQRSVDRRTTSLRTRGHKDTGGELSRALGVDLLRLRTHSTEDVWNTVGVIGARSTGLFD
jgi:hypothetical protein